MLHTYINLIDMSYILITKVMNFMATFDKTQNYVTYPPFIIFFYSIVAIISSYGWLSIIHARTLKVKISNSL